MDIYRTYDRAVENPHIAIVDFFGDDISREFIAFQKAFEDSGLTCEICEITDLSYENGKLLSPSGKQINAIYRRAVTCDIMRNYDKVQPFIKAAENNDVCLIGDFKTQVIHNKIVFKVLHDDMTSAFLTDEEKQYVKDHIPYTASLTQEEIDKHDVLNTKDKWVIKPEDSYASKGVYAGVEGMSDHAWKEEVLSNVDNHYLLQEYCTPYATWNIDITHDENAKYKKYSNITGMYVYNGKLAGLYSRIAKNSIISTQYSEMSLPTIVAVKIATKGELNVTACRQKCLHAGRGREISSDFMKMNSSAYVCTLEFIFQKCTGKPYIEDSLPVAFIAIN